MIEVRSLHAGYHGEAVLWDISFRISRGEMVGILGPNGSGKSTLLLALHGLLPIRSGEIRIGEKDIHSFPALQLARKMAAVPQESPVSFPFRCINVVLMGRYPHLSRWGDYSHADLNVATSVMEQTETLNLAYRRMNEISGGESQTICIARALAQESEVLLLDEATANLDVARKIRVFNLLSRKNREGTTLLCVMHDLNLAALYCPRLIFLKEGRLALDGPTEEIFNDQNLSRIYETDIRVTRHPVTGSPQAHFVPHAPAPAMGARAGRTAPGNHG